jgi:hypothetical protein
MSARTFCLLAAVLFAVMALVQLSRPLMEWSVTINGHDLPTWPNWLAFFVFGTLSVFSFTAAGRRNG